ncbi:MAG: PilC/PilY family type IV pilus protein [Burkholderiaceae bacterium]
MTSTQLGYLGSTSAEQTDLIEYTRGNRAKEDVTLRKRTSLFGDIINSEATYVGAPPERYNNSTHPGFDAFKATTAVASRTPMLYVGANDGMLHALNASTSTSDGGNEKWAYIPSFVLSGPSSPANPQADGLAARASLGSFTHKYYVDQTPSVRSVNFAHTGVAPSGGFGSGSPDWRSLLVAGLNKGGRGYYAIDVTDPAQWTSEANVASKVLWEFSDADMGLSYGRPMIVYTKKYGWVVIVTSGYNNTQGAVADRGKGFLYVLNAKTGALLEKIGTGVGSAATPSGLAQVNAFVADYREMTIDYVYGGDLLGNLWRFDLTQIAGSAGTYPAPVKLAVLTDGTNPQPVTTEPRIEIARDRVSRWLFIGTGQLMSDADIPSTATQTFYAFRDGTVTTPNTSGSFPLDRSSLAPMTDPLAGVTPTSDGWYMDLTLHPGASGSPAERVVTAPSANEGFIAFIGQKPNNDPCSPALTSYIYAVEYATGRSRLEDGSGNRIDSFLVPSTSGYGLGVIWVKDAQGKMRPIYSTSSGGPNRLQGNFNTPSGVPTRLQWREVLQ